MGRVINLVDSAELSTLCSTSQMCQRQAISLKVWNIYFLLIIEREENVKADIFHAYITLLRQTRPTVSSDPDAMEQDGG